MKILNIPFISKPKSISKTIGIAKYLIDENGYILEQWCELLEGTEFRGKKLNKKTGKYYGNDFEKSKIDFRKKIMDNDLNKELLSKNKLEIVNKYFFENLGTFLSHDDYITGSHASGSESDNKRTPYIIYGGKYNQFMFVNFFKRYTLNKKGKKKLRFGDFKKINLDEYFELFPKIENEFFDFNKQLFTALVSEELNQETYEIDNSKKSNEYIDLILSPEYEIQNNLQETEINEKRVQTLRRIFKNRLKNIRPSDHLFGKLPEDMCEAAHIFPVSEIKKLDIQYWYMIADENNGLNLPTQFHKLYDSNKIFFDENGIVKFTNEEYKNHLSIMFSTNTEFRVIDNVLNKKRADYIKKYNQRFNFK